jgi:hypothetical protein
MHDSCMATKTITLEIDAYERLRRARSTPRESFSSVVRRARWDGAGATGPEVLASLDALVRSRPEMLLSEEALSAIEARALNRPVRESRIDDRL